MGGNQRRAWLGWRRHTAFAVTITMLAGFCSMFLPPTAAQAAPPPTADQDVKDFWNALDALQSFSQGLASDGAFGQALTDIGLSPGSADGLGFGTLFQKLFIDRLTSANPMHLADLVTALKASGLSLESNGRTASLNLTSSSSGSVESLAFDITVNRQVLSAPLALSVATPKFDFSAPVQVDLAFHTTFTVNYDTVGRAVFIDTATSPPTMTLGAHAHFPCASGSPPCTQDTSGVHAGIGILGIDLAAGSSFDLTTNLKATLRDPNGDGRVALGTFAGGTFQPFAEPNGSGGTKPGELAGGAAAAAGMVTVGFDTNPGALHATLNLVASTQGSFPLPSVNATVQADWADISTGTPSVSVTSGSLSVVQSFQNLSPRDLAQGLAQVATALESIQSSRTYTPVSGGKTGTTAAIADGSTTSSYTVSSGGAPAVDDFFQIGGAGGEVRDVAKVDGTGPYTLTFGSPVNGAVAGGTTLTQVNGVGNIDLPFMKGTLADVFAANEAVVAFLNRHVTQLYNALPGGRSGTLSSAGGQTASYTAVSGGAPQAGDFYQIGAATRKVTAVSGTGPYALTFGTAFNPAPPNGTAAVQVQLGDIVPDFASIQSLLSELAAEAGLPGGSKFLTDTVTYDPSSSKLIFGLGVSRAQQAAADLDPFVAVDSGTGTYATDPATGNPSVTDTTKSWTPNAYAGRLVRAGSSSNVVKGNDANTIVFTGAWHGGAPANGTTYQIGGPDSQVGSVSFANKLSQLAAGSGIINANAQVPVATVQPSYAAHLTLVLDLEAPQTGAGCVGKAFNGTTNSQSCPFTATNADGTSTVVTQLPTSADRVMLRTADPNGPLHLLTADAPIHTQIDINANVGFLGLHLTGTLDECAAFSSGTTCPDPAAATTHLLSIDFASGLGDSQHDIALGDVFHKLASSPKSVIAVSVKGQVKATITPDVPGVSGFFGVTPPAFSMSMSDITDPSTIAFDAGSFSGALDKIKAFNFDTSNPKALFDEILQTLKTLSKLLKTVGGSTNPQIQQVLGTRIPVVGLKLGDVFAASEQGQGDKVSYSGTTLTDADAHFTNDLLLRSVVAGTSTGIILSTTATSLTVGGWQGGAPTNGTQYQVENPLDSAIDLLTANPADNLQQLIGLVNQRLGASSIPITFSVDTSSATPVLGLAIDWKHDFHFTTPMAFDFNLGSSQSSIVGTQGRGLVKLHATAEAKAKLLLPLAIANEGGATDATGLMVDPTNTSLSAGVGADVTGYIKANFGPLSLSLGQPVDTSPTHPAEAHATFSAGLASTDTAPESISSFLSNIASGGIQFNQGATGVTCAGDTTPNLGLCAALPLYLSTDGGQTYNPVVSGTATDPDTLRLRLPLLGDLSKEFALTDPSGNVLTVDPTDNTTPPRLEIPASLKADLAKAVLDFSQLGQGLDGYFKFAEQTLNLASFGGKLPLVGKDLQEGAQFLEKVQSNVDAKLGDLASVSDEAGLKNWINTELASALNGVLPPGSTLSVDFICSVRLATPGNVAGTAVTGTTNDYQYRVSATDPKGETVASPAITVKSAPLSTTDTVTVSWDKVDGADGYKVYRSGDAGATWAQFGVGQADHPSFTDTGAAGTTATPRDGNPATDNPQLEPCPLTDITGLTLATDIGQGKVTKTDGCVDDGASTCITGLSTPLNIGIPGLSISAATTGGVPDPSQNVSVKLGWRIHLKIGLDKNRGFFIETQDQANPEISLGVAVSLPKSIQANIAFLKINLCDFNNAQTYPPASGASCTFAPLVPNGVTRTPAGPQPLFAGMFGIDVHTPGGVNAFTTTITPNDDPANDITLKDLTNFAQLKSLVTVGLSAAVHIDWDFQVTADQALPGVGGEFKLDWKWGVTSGKPDVATETGDDATPPVGADGAPGISFVNVYITAGGFLSGVLKPIVKEVQSFTSPLKPVIDTLYAPIPVLSDLSHLAGGGDVTLITMAEAFSTLAGGPDLTMVQRIIEVIQLINSIPAGDNGFGIFIGTFSISGAKAINTTSTPTNTETLISSKTPAPDSQNGGKNVSDAVDGQAGGKVNESSAKGGFSFPILQSPSSVFNLLMGGDIDLVRFDSGNLTLGFSYSQAFGPVYAPPPVLITISGSASVTARIIAGFDTYGLRKGFEAIKSGARPGSVVLSILDSLFLYTVDPTKNDGKPVPVLTLHGELAAGAEVSVVIVTVGVEGGIALTINFYWNDPDNDGKFRTSEFLATALANPLCLFNTDGQLSVFLRVFVTIGIGPFSATFSFTLVNITLLDFSIHPNCSPPPPELAEVQDHVLYLFFGKLGANSERGSPWGNDSGANAGADETVKVHELHDNTTNAFTGFAVDGLSRHEEFLDGSITTVVLDARGYSGKENVVVSGDSNQTQPVSSGPPPARPFDKTAIVFGGNNDDTIKIDGGTAHVDGGGGNDTINLTGGGNDFVAGGPGNDTITTGNGNDTIAGDGSLPVTSSATLADHRQIDTSNPPQPTGSWANVPGVPNGVGAPGAGEASTDGSDSILAGYGKDTIYGNGGDDSISLATDKPLTGSETRQPGVNAASDGTTIVGGTGNNHIHGGSGADIIYAGQQWPAVGDPANYGGVAGDGTNVVDTGGGNDTVYGGSGSDFVTGHSASGGKDIIYGAGGDDVLTGGDGADQIFGGPGNDYLSGGPAKVDPLSPPDAVLGAWKITPTPDGAPVDGKLLVGGDSTDHIYGANGGDQIYADRQEDTCVTPPALTTLSSAASIGDTVVNVASTTGLRVGAAFMIDPTSTIGEAYPITAVGASSVTLASALVHAHALGAAAGEPRSTPPPEVYTASPAGDNYIVGGNGNNVITGGAGNDTVFAGVANDLICGGGGKDTIHGGAGHDTVFGGSGDDLILGGSGNSALYGNDGNDTILGGSGSDWIEGNAGTDTIDGGSANGVIIGGSSAPMQSDTGDTINGGSGSAVVIIGDNGTVDANAAWPGTGAPYATTPNRIHVYDLDANAPANTTYGGSDTIWGGPGNDEIYGGLAGDYIVGGTGVDHIEGGPGCDTIFGGTQGDDIIGGTSPQAVGGNAAFVDGVPDGCDGSGNAVTPATIGTFTPVTGDTISGFLPYGPNPLHHNVIVGGNGSITRTGATDPNDGAAVRKVQLLALLHVGGNDTIFGGPGDDQIFGGLGDDAIRTGNGNNYVEGGPGSNTIYGGSGSNDIIGGTSPLALPLSGPDALTTAGVPSGNDTIFADGRIAPPPAGTPQDGGDVVLGDNGCISRGTAGAPVDANGCPTGPSTSPALWTRSTADQTVAAPGTLVRPVIRQLDVFDCPNASCATPDVQGAADLIYGGTGDDLLFGEVGNDQVYGGPPGTNGLAGSAGTFAGNDYLEGGSGSDTMAGGAGDDDMIGGSAPTYLAPGKTTAMISDGIPSGGGFTLPPPANPLLSIGGSGTVGNVMDGGGGNDDMVGGNGTITRNLDAGGKWVINPNDGATVRTVVQLDLANGGAGALGGDDTMRGGSGDDKMFGGTGNDLMDGGAGDDYLEGGPGRNILQGGAGDDDLVGGTSPVAVAPQPGLTSEQVAAAMPNGTPDPANPGQRLGNIICGYYCGQSLAVGAGSDDDVVVGNNGRIDRCPATVSGGVGTPKGSDACTWTRTTYGTEKASSFPNGATGGAQTAALCTAVGPGCPVVSLGNPRTRFTTLLGQDPAETTHNGNDYIEGNGGNDQMFGEDGNDAIHGDTPAPNSPVLNECLPTNDPAAGQDIIVGGYGNDTLCGDGGDDAILGNRGLVGVLNTAGPWAGTSGAVTPVPFSATTTVIGTTSGGPFGTLTEPTSGNTIYPVRLDVEYVDGVLTPVPNWNNPTAQANQHDIIFGGQGNDTIHGSPGDDFLQGDDGPHIAGQPAPVGGDDILFGGGGNDSIQGGPGNDHIFGGDNNDDQDVVRSDTGIAPKVDESGACLPPAFPTLNVNPSSVGAANGFCNRAGFWANASYASRFPTVGAAAYDSDPGALDNGGQTSRTNVFGDLLYGGYNRDISQSQGTPPGFGDRIIDSLGAYNLEFVCPAAYGGSQIIRSLSPGMLTFLQQLGRGDGAYNVNQGNKPPTTNSSGDSEVSIVYPGTNVPDNGGSAYPNTAGHFTC